MLPWCDTALPCKLCVRDFKLLPNTISFTAFSHIAGERECKGERQREADRERERGRESTSAVKYNKNNKIVWALPRSTTQKKGNTAEISLCRPEQHNGQNLLNWVIASASTCSLIRKRVHCHCLVQWSWTLVPYSPLSSIQSAL